MFVIDLWDSSKSLTLMIVRLAYFSVKFNSFKRISYLVIADCNYSHSSYIVNIYVFNSKKKAVAIISHLSA